jgi:hypothetical protein
MRSVSAVILALLGSFELLASGSVVGQTMSISPSAGQTPEQQASDRASCETQAAATSGYHPSQPPPAPVVTKPVMGQRAAGAARGAALGAVRAQTTDKGEREIDDPTAAGARAGAVAGGVRQRQARRERAVATRQQQAAQQQAEAAYGQQLAACMQARGYTVQ